jgi:dipeptidyl aminopeptidase/acylaminoacyl peptidase
MARRTLYLPVMVAAAVLLACLAAVATLLAVSKEAESTFPAKNGKIAFVSTRDSKFPESGDIYTMNPNGTAVHRLTNHPELDFEPAWSADGSKITFASYRHDNEDISTPCTPTARAWSASPTIVWPTLTPTGNLSRPPTTGPSR